MHNDFPDTPSANKQHREFEPPEALRDSIRCFWYDSNVFAEQATQFEVVPDGYAEIIFYFGNLCSIADNGDLQPLPSPFMIGLLHQPALFSTNNRLQILGIRCFPWTVFDLLGLPSGKDSLRVFEHPLAQLHPILNACIHAGKIEEAVMQIKDYFLNAHAHIAADSLLFKAGAAMRKAKGQLPVSEVATAAHATLRTLERKFKQSSGHSVKDVSALMRFEQVRNRLFLDPESNLAGLAQDLGYTDQSHLSREFKRFSGTTPGAFARNAKKAQHLFHSDFVAFIQA